MEHRAAACLLPEASSVNVRLRELCLTSKPLIQCDALCSIPSASVREISQKPKLILLSLALLLSAIFASLVSNLVDFPVYYTAGRSLISGRTDLYAADFAAGRVMDYRRSIGDTGQSRCSEVQP
jgi:hypothetical protein